MRALAIVVVIVFSSIVLGCDPGYFVEEQNNQNIAKLEIGMDGPTVKDIMGQPVLREVYEQADGSVVEVLFYYTNFVWGDNAMTQDEMTPICIYYEIASGKFGVDKGRLVGWGQKYYTADIGSLTALKHLSRIPLYGKL